MNAKFLEEAKQLENRWAKAGLLDNRPAAVLLECQRLHNETGTWDCCDDCKEREKVAVLVINDTRTMITPAKTPKAKRMPWWLKKIQKQLMVCVV